MKSTNAAPLVPTVLTYVHALALVLALASCGDDGSSDQGTGGTGANGSTGTGATSASGGGGASGYQPGDPPGWDWVRTAAGVGNTNVTRMDACADLVLVAAQGASSVVFDEGGTGETTLSGTTLLAAYGLDGTFQWGLPVQGTNADVRDILLLDDCSAIVSFWAADQLVIGAEAPVVGPMYSTYLARLSSDGAVEWVVSQPATAITWAGGTVVTASIQSFAPYAISLHGVDASDGSELWSRPFMSISEGGTLALRELATSTDGRLLGVGQWDDNYSGQNGAVMTLDPGGNATVLNPVGSDGDLFVFEIEANGALLWATQWADVSSPYARHMALDAEGNLTFGGQGYGNQVGFVVHVDTTTHEVAWTRSWTPPAYFVNTLAWLDGALTVTGQAQAGDVMEIETGVGDEVFELPELTSQYGTLELGYDATGRLVWHRVTSDVGMYAALGGSAGLFLAGGYVGTPSFDGVTVPNASDQALFVGRLTP